MTEPVKDYADPLIKARKHLNHLESLLRKRDMKAAAEEAVLLQDQCWKLIDYCEDENGKD